MPGSSEDRAGHHRAPRGPGIWAFNKWTRSRRIKRYTCGAHSARPAGTFRRARGGRREGIPRRARRRSWQCRSAPGARRNLSPAGQDGGCGEGVAGLACSTRLRRRSNAAGKNLSGTEKTGSRAGGGGTRPETCAELCRSETIARTFAEFQAGREKARRRRAMIPRCRLIVRYLDIGQPRSSATLLVLIALCACVIFLRLPSAGADQRSSEPVVLELNLDGVVDPILATYIDEGLEDAARRQASLVLITMDTPGGLSDSMKDMIQHILVSRVPVAVYVSPTGARGASAGFYILLSADIAAMAPATHTGSATPVIVIGGLLPMQIDEACRKKINNDAMAFLRSFTERRGRNPVLAEKAITEGKAFTEKEALDAKMIDLIAISPDDLLRQLDGRTISRFDGTQTTFSLKHASRKAFELSTRQKFLARIVQPDVVFVLLILGVLGLYTEFTHPGVILPGVVGGICLVLALYALNFLPVNLAGLFLILLALVFFILEAKMPSHGVLALGGVISMFLGAIFLIRSPLTPGGVSVGVALAGTVPFAVLAVFLMRLVLRSRKWKTATGREELIGSEGVVVKLLQSGAEGLVRVHGELWQAESAQPVQEGKTVRIVRVEGLKLYVEPVDAAGSMVK